MLLCHTTHQSPGFTVEHFQHLRFQSVNLSAERRYCNRSHPAFPNRLTFVNPNLAFCHLPPCPKRGLGQAGGSALHQKNTILRANTAAGPLTVSGPGVWGRRPGQAAAAPAVAIPQRCRCRCRRPGLHRAAQAAADARAGALACPGSPDLHPHRCG